MIDRDLAELYGVETKRLKEQVNRNLEWSPPSFYVRSDPGRKRNLKVAKCDLKTRRSLQVPALCIYGAWRINVVQCIKERQGH